MAADNMRANLSILPRELTIIILSKLPFKPILRCKAVCKEWLDIVTSDPTFAKTHYDQNKSLAILCHKTIMDGYKNKPKDDDDQRFDDGIVTLGASWDGFDVMNSCMGFLLMRKRVLELDCEPYRAYNPLTNEAVFVPNLSMVESYNNPNRDFSYALGFSQVVKRFKVVLFVHDIQLKSYSLHICTLGSTGNYVRTHGKSTNCAWRTVSLPEGHHHVLDKYLMNTPFEFNGVLHWIAIVKKSISCFDVEKEELGKMSFPPSIGKSSEKHVASIGVYMGLLCLGIYVYGNPCRLEMWVMKEYGINNSWMLLVDVNLRKIIADVFHLYVKFTDPKLVEILDTGEIIFLFTQVLPWSYHLCSYDPITECFEKLSFPWDRGDYYSVKENKSAAKYLYIPSFFYVKDF